MNKGELEIFKRNATDLLNILKIDNVTVNFTSLENGDTLKVDVFYFKKCVFAFFVDKDSKQKEFDILYSTVLHTLQSVEFLRGMGYIQ